MTYYDYELTEVATRIFEKAKDLAHQYRFALVESGHLLSAMTTIPGSIAYTILMNQNVDPEDMLLDLEEITSQNKVKKDKIKLSPRVEAIIEEAYNIATNNGTEVIGSEHLLYSILQNDQGSASQLLKLQKKFQ